MPRTKLNRSFLEKALKILHDTGIEQLAITGGEPFIERELLYYIVEKAIEYDMRLAIETNGTMLNSKDYDLLSRYAEYLSLSISLDSIDPLKFDTFRGYVGAYKKVIDSIKRLRVFNIDIQLIMSVYKANVDEIPAIIQKSFEEFNIQTVKLNVVTPIGRGKELHDTESFIDLYKKLLMYLNEIPSKYRNRVYSNLPPALIDMRIKPTICDYKNLISILPDKSISLCGIGIEFEELRIPIEIDESNIVNIWLSSPLYKTLSSIEPTRVVGICARCIFSKICCNFCPATVYSVYKDFFRSHPWCQLLWERGLFPRKFVKQL